MLSLSLSPKLKKKKKKNDYLKYSPSIIQKYCQIHHLTLVWAIAPLPVAVWASVLFFWVTVNGYLGWNLVKGDWVEIIHTRGLLLEICISSSLLSSHPHSSIILLNHSLGWYTSIEIVAEFMNGWETVVLI